MLLSDSDLDGGVAQDETTSAITSQQTRDKSLEARALQESELNFMGGT
jgi:hypothetical protein